MAAIAARNVAGRMPAFQRGLAARESYAIDSIIHGAVNVEDPIQVSGRGFSYLRWHKTWTTSCVGWRCRGAFSIGR